MHTSQEVEIYPLLPRDSPNLLRRFLRAARIKGVTRA